MVPVEVHQLRPRQHARRSPPSARKRPNGTAFLRALAPSRARIATPDDRAAQERDQQRRRDREPEVEAHHAGQLHVAHPHARRIGERGHEQEREGGGAGDQVLRQVAGVGERGGRSRPIRPSDRRSGSAAAGGPGRCRPARSGRPRRAARAAGRRRTRAPPRPRRTRRAVQQLDERVARRDRGAAVPAAPAQHEPGDERHVVVGRQRRAAATGSGSPGATSDSPSGTRWITTLRKLPSTAPRTAASCDLDRHRGWKLLRGPETTTGGPEARPSRICLFSQLWLPVTRGGAGAAAGGGAGTGDRHRTPAS